MGGKGQTTWSFAAVVPVCGDFLGTEVYRQRPIFPQIGAGHPGLGIKHERLRPTRYIDGTQPIERGIPARQPSFEKLDLMGIRLGNPNLMERCQVTDVIGSGSQTYVAEHFGGGNAHDRKSGRRDRLLSSSPGHRPRRWFHCRVHCARGQEL